MEIRDWVEAYGQAWRQRDPEAAAALFTEDASYRSSPFVEAHLGHEGVRAYWAQATSTQADVRVRMGEPLVEGRFAAVEWWTVMRVNGDDITLPGCLLLRFAEDGRCEDLREYWNLTEGRFQPHAGWGSWGSG